MRYLTSLLLAAAAVTGSGCATQSPAYYPISAEQAEANRRNIARIEQESRDLEHVERMRRAQAAEIATRNAPRRISTSTTTVFAPRF